MNKNKIIIITIIVLFIIGGGVYGIFHLIDSIKKENEEVKIQMEDIKTNYESLNENAILFNSKKEEYDNLMENVYYNNMKKKNSEILKVLEEYDNIISSIIENGNNLEDKCSMYYTDNDTMQRCNSYKISYESAMVVFNNDIKRYNTLVDNYNNWSKENEKNPVKVEYFKSKFVK